MRSSDEFLQILNAWKSSRDVIRLYWSSPNSALKDLSVPNCSVEDFDIEEVHLAKDDGTRVMLSFKDATFSKSGPGRFRADFTNGDSLMISLDMKEI